MKRVLFVCTGNTCRSPMAELIFNTKAREKGINAQAQSAGLCTIEGLLINDNSYEALKEIAALQGVKDDAFINAFSEHIGSISILEKKSSNSFSIHRSYQREILHSCMTDEEITEIAH